MAQPHKGTAKEGVGEILGDEKLKAGGRMDRAEGKVRDAVGGAKDAARDMGKPRHH